MDEYYSNGKLLITGEYLVLKGATSLALPLKLGQRMMINSSTHPSGKIYWNTYVKDQLWFQSVYSLQNFDILYSSDVHTAMFVRKILLQALKLNADFSDNMKSVNITNYLDFSPMFGLGSSSSLISNIAYWMKVDPFDLLRQTCDGSGYDVACARAPGPISYKLNHDIPFYWPVDFIPSYSEYIYFVYLGKKVLSQSSIKEFRVNLELNSNRVTEISAITQSIINANSIREFEELIVQHENILSKVLNMPTIKSQLFSDYWGCIKSMGAWGGDFILVTSQEDRSEVEAYFRKKGLPIVYGYQEIVL